MVLNQYFAALLGGILLAWSGASTADEYRPDEFLKLDLLQAVLSPKLLGPPTQFEPVAVEAKADPGVTAKPVHAAQVKSVHTAEVKSVSAAKPHVPARARVVRRHSNPLDAQASDTRIQVWPCRSGGICDWRR